jgi:hypothetical protein
MLESREERADRLGRVAYVAHCMTAAGGGQLPAWGLLRPELRGGWISVATAVERALLVESNRARP